MIHLPDFKEAERYLLLINYYECRFFTTILLSVISLLVCICSTYGIGKVKKYIETQKRLKDEHDMLIGKYQDYAKRLLVAFSHLENRLSDIKGQTQSIESLKTMPSKNNTIEWYTKEGYYITSTAWLLAKISCLINQYQEETKFIGCRQSKSNELGGLLEDYQYQIKSCGLLEAAWFVEQIGRLYLIEAECLMRRFTPREDKEKKK